MTPVSGVIFSIWIALTIFIQIFPGFLPHSRISPGYMATEKAQKAN